MRAFWIRFEDGTEACCEGATAGDAALIAEKIAGKRVQRRPGQELAPTWVSGAVHADPLPYPATPVIWQLDHPVHGKHPTFCHDPKHCIGRSSCPRPIACDD